MNIAGHTDDDYWYPLEVDERPIFVSLTFYLDGKPIKDEYYSRFQIKVDGKWKDIKLDDNSVMFMNSDIPHRVMKHKKKMKNILNRELILHYVQHIILKLIHYYIIYV